ncbi:MAG TPA: RidA family protein [Streptosporangiaceae bacterium]|nr:RidA family protein [Streptosporangiaceae bacterium]
MTHDDTVAARLAQRGHPLPAPWAVPPDANIPATLVRITGDTAWVSGHIPTDLDGHPTTTLGTVGTTVTPKQATDLAIRTALSLLASLKQSLDTLDRINAWCQLTCMVNADRKFTDYPSLFNPASQLILDAFGPQIGAHARTAVGLAGLPWNAPVEIAATVQIDH